MMKHAGMLSLALVASALALGCGNSGLSPAATSAELTAAKTHRQDTADQSAVADQAKVKYAREMRKRLDQLETKYAELRVRAADADGRAKTDLERKLEAVKLKRDAACRKLDALNDSGSDGWQKAKEGFETVLVELYAEFEKPQ